MTTTKKQLTGSEKQIAWAEDIRDRAEKNIRDLYTSRIADCDERIANPRPTVMRRRSQPEGEGRVIRTAEQNAEVAKAERDELQAELEGAIETLYSIESAKAFIDHRGWGSESGACLHHSAADAMRDIREGRLAL